MRNFTFIILIGLVLVRCDRLDRDNPLDPKNPKATFAQMTTVELFVNDSTGYDYCRYAIDAIERLAQRTNYQDKVCVLEYHLTNRTLGWNDSYALDEFNQRYYSYVPIVSERGIPDAMFNGLMMRVQGASMETIEQRYAAALEPLLVRTSPFYIQAIKKISNNSIELDVRLAMYGTTMMQNLHLIPVLYEDLNMPGHRFLVRKILQEQIITQIQHGEIQSFHVSAPLPAVSDVQRLYAIVLVQDQKSAKKEILQAARF